MTDETTITEAVAVSKQPLPEPFGYVTYGTAGSLDGAYFQVPPEAHLACLIAVDEDTRANWCAYRANEARDAVELAPVVPPEELPPAIPRSVTRRQARQALLLAGLLDQVPAKIAAIPDLTARGMAQIEWEDSQDFQRERPLVLQIGAALGLDATALDQLFITAAGL